jgi:hypothetical protein
MDETIKKGIEELQKRALTGALEVGTPQWWRAYWRAHPTKLEELMSRQLPQQITGAGPLGEHVFKVIHSIKQSPLDSLGVQPTEAIEGELVQKVESSG